MSKTPTPLYILNTLRHLFTNLTFNEPFKILGAGAAYWLKWLNFWNLKKNTTINGGKKLRYGLLVGHNFSHNIIIILDWILNDVPSRGKVLYDFDIRGHPKTTWGGR